MKFVIKNRNPIRSLFAILLCGNAAIFYVVPHDLWPISLQGIFVFYNLTCALILFALSRRRLSVEIMNDCLQITGLFSTRKIRNADIKSTEVQTYETKGKPIRIYRLGVSGQLPIIFSEDMFDVDGDYDALVKSLSWVENKYSHNREPGWKGAASDYSGQLVTYSVVLIMIAFNAILLLMSQDGFLWAMDNFALSKKAVESREYYRFVSAFFLHLSPVHLLINIISLGALGGMLERHLRRARYFNILILSTFSGWMFSLAFSQFNLVAGASGGVFGLFGSYVALKVVSRGTLQPSIDPMPFWWVVIILILQVVADLYINDSDLSAHFGGGVGGITCFVLSRFSFEKSIAVEKLVALTLLFLCIFSFSSLIR